MEISFVLMGWIDTLLDYSSLSQSDVNQIRSELQYYPYDDAILVLNHIQNNLKEPKLSQTDIRNELKKRIDLEDYYERRS